MPRPTLVPDTHVRQESLQHLGWPLVCLALGEHLRTPMALARLEAELDQHDRGGGGLPDGEAYAASIAGRSAEADLKREKREMQQARERAVRQPHRG